MYFHTSQLLCKLYSENMIFLSFTATTIQLNCRYLMVWCSLLALKVLLNPDQPTLVVQILVSFRLLLIVTKCVGTVLMSCSSIYICVCDWQFGTGAATSNVDTSVKPAPQPQLSTTTSSAQPKQYTETNIQVCNFITASCYVCILGEKCIFVIVIIVRMCLCYKPQSYALQRYWSRLMCVLCDLKKNSGLTDAYVTLWLTDCDWLTDWPIDWDLTAISAQVCYIVPSKCV